MTGLDPKATQLRLEEILKLIRDRESETARAQIDALVSELKLLEGSAPQASGGAPETWRLIAAHLKAADVEIEATHLASAEESLGKAIGAVTEDQGPAAAK